MRGISTWFFHETLCVSGAGGKPLSNGGPPEARLGFQGAPSITMGCGACWDETCREKGDVVRGGWADVARRLPASSSIWVAHCGAGRTLSFGDKVFSLSDCLRFAPELS